MLLIQAADALDNGDDVECGDVGAELSDQDFGTELSDVDRLRDG